MPNDLIQRPHDSVTLEQEMRTAYLDYAMSVIISRALPDTRDGLKPVQRRILYSMLSTGLDWSRPHRKSARVVGDVIGRLHPHGDQPIYEAMVRLAQDFSMREPLVDGQGNFGSMDGDPPAALRYTEARLAALAEAMLADIDRDTVDFIANYDESDREPTVLPARFPNVLVNGASGIAVGMATTIPPHNLGEIIDASCALLADPSLSVDSLLQYVPGPDFPTGGIIIGTSGVQDAYATGRGSITLRGRAKVVEGSPTQIIISEIPYQVNKARMIERFADLINAKTIEGVSDLRDESDRDGVRVVLDIKRDGNAEVILNQLYQQTALQGSVGVNMLAIHGGRPLLLNLQEILLAFLQHRREVVRRRSIFELDKARKRAHLLLGFAVAIADIDEVIRLIRSSKDVAQARESLMARPFPLAAIQPLLKLVRDEGVADTADMYHLSEAQARGILELRLQRLTALERERIDTEMAELDRTISELLEILSSAARLQQLIRDELLEVKEKFANPRRTEIIEGPLHIDIESLIAREDMVVTISHEGYAKRTPLSVYRAQRRGGRGRSGMATHDKDFVSRLFIASTHASVLFFTRGGIAHQMKVYRLPEGSPTSRGKSLVNLLSVPRGEGISAILPLREEDEIDEWDIVFATANGTVRRNALRDFTNIKANGKIAMKLSDANGTRIDTLIGASLCREGQHDVFLATQCGRCIRFSTGDVRRFSGRVSTGVRGIQLDKDDRVISLSILDHITASPEEREAYLRYQRRRSRTVLDDETVSGLDLFPVTDSDKEIELDAERLRMLEENEQFLLNVTENGFGKRSSAYEYRIVNRGGKGITNAILSDRTGLAVGSFPIVNQGEVILVTHSGQLIRFSAKEIRIAGRRTQGVMLFRFDQQDRVVAVGDIPIEDDADSEGEDA